jgi:hypothetical protein
MEYYVRVIGLRQENYNGNVSSYYPNYNHKTNSTRNQYIDTITALTAQIVCLKEMSTNKKFELRLTMEDAPCYSGYCVSTTCNVEMSSVAEWKLMTHVPKDSNVKIKFNPNNRNWNDDDNFKCSLFEYEKDSGDYYYPNGSYTIHFDQFDPVDWALTKLNPNSKYKNKNVFIRVNSL